MFKMIKKVMQYPRLTVEYPKVPFQKEFVTGKPVVDEAKCNQCGECKRRCPSSAIRIENGQRKIGIHLDGCIFCSLCEEVCPQHAIKMSSEFELATTPNELERDSQENSVEVIGKRVSEKIKKLYGRSLHIREVDAGSCNGCDYEINALNNPFNDVERFGIHFVASPRHADMLLVTGTATRNMELALVKTYNAVPDPKMVVAVGACACNGGIFKDSYATCNGISSLIPVDAYIPGCPPRPQALMYGILKALNKLEKRA